MTKEKFLNLIPVLVIFITIVIFAATLFAMKKANDANLPAPPKLMTFPDKKLVSGHIFGDLNAPYTLIEFGDYECPPCRGQSEKVFKYLSDNPKKLRYIFHNFPLNFHPQAMPAAQVAESIENNGKFWEMHKRLMHTTDLKQEIANLGKQVTVSQVGTKQVEQDMKLAKELSINSTPSFFLCCPDGKVYKLTQLPQVEELLRETSK
jgi:protein-disulfide isomerase